jgi:hypothetical protein
MNWLEDERPQSDTPEYFEKQLDSLDLSVRRIRRQSEGDLRRSLIVANDAIENHESFGKITVLIPSKGKEWSTDYSPEFKVETGILPFLLERKKLVLKELQQYDRRGYEKTSVDDTEIDKTKIRDELTKMAERTAATSWRISIASKRGWRRCGSYSPLRGRSCPRCYRPCWIGRLRESCDTSKTKLHSMNFFVFRQL